VEEVQRWLPPQFREFAQALRFTDGDALLSLTKDELAELLGNPQAAQMLMKKIDKLRQEKQPTV
jgi:hypothetical protein